MGQRSQIYVRCKNDEETKVIAKYFQWNYGERMVSRARSIMEYINDRGYIMPYHWDILDKIIDVNFDYRDIVKSTDIFKDFENFDYGCKLKDFVWNQDNNDGKLLIDVIIVDSETIKIKYAFINYDNAYIGTPANYLDTDVSEWKTSFDLDVLQFTRENIDWITENVDLMTEEEVSQYIDTFCDSYVSPVSNVN